MRSAKPDDRDVAEVIFDLEEDVRNIRSWSRALVAIGCSGVHIDPSAIYVMGEALGEVAERVIEEWAHAFDLTHPEAKTGEAIKCV